MTGHGAPRSSAYDRSGHRGSAPMARGGREDFSEAHWERGLAVGSVNRAGDEEDNQQYFGNNTMGARTRGGYGENGHMIKRRGLQHIL
jgi:hypothetical protein